MGEEGGVARLWADGPTREGVSVREGGSVEVQGGCRDGKRREGRGEGKEKEGEGRGEGGYNE